MKVFLVNLHNINVWVKMKKTKGYRFLYKKKPSAINKLLLTPIGKILPLWYPISLNRSNSMNKR